MEESSVDILTEWDIVAARQLGRREAKLIGFGLVDQARITTAISELARNIYLYAEQGKIEVRRIAEKACIGICIIASDSGPGIEDVEQVMQAGFSTSQGFGAGLPGVRRLMDEFEIKTKPQKGTIITIKKWLQLDNE
ncbi:anti-sigma regulatory factor [Rummeliibacillus suwonensis]|jgi:serine/threonine-protein kinase RsbT|uniref:anti-sigma regulatory factor n=1 Tax=Rummeliibacillus suwonensis TaxID=1306154 RepID=UPI0011B7EA3B|nr:anti-sigma regulatory factor [Rummeliibacillus suwonensis]MBO2537066.1 anti-sigma regulatory factor [Rummeliibacillus suwonensis]